MTRSQLDLQIDTAWHQARFATDPDCAAKHWARHNELVRERAMKAPNSGGLDAAGAPCRPVAKSGVDGQLP